MTDTPQTTDIFKFQGTAEDGFDFAQNNDTLTIAAGVMVGSADQIGIVSEHTNNQLTNNGTASGYYAGVDFDGSGGGIINNIGATIVGQQDGIEIFVDSTSVANHGTINGFLYNGVYYDQQVNTFSFSNDGIIFGHGDGVGLYGGSGTINNLGTGLINSDQYGVDVDGNTQSIFNALHATIRGLIDSIRTHEFGGIVLSNFGTLIGNVACAVANAHDAIVNHGTVTGSIDLGPGNDSFTDAGAGRVAGVIHGGDGLDRFVADKVRESFFGDGGADTFVFNAAVFTPATNQRDVIGDFSHLEADKIDVHAIDADTVHAGNQAFVFIGADSFAHYHSLHPGAVGMLRFDAATERLQGNVNSDFTHADFEVGLPNVTALHANDFIL